MQKSWSFARALRTHGLIAVAVLAYMWFGLSATAAVFFEAYHATEIDMLYYVYSAFKAAGAFLPEYGFMVPAALAVAGSILLISLIISRLRGNN